MNFDDAKPIYDREIVTTRVFRAPPQLVWRAWSEPEQLARWWGPTGFTNTFHQFDFAPGGEWVFTMHGPDGRNYANTMRFLDIVPMQRIVMDHVSPPIFRLTALFEAYESGTKLTFRQLFETPEVHAAVKGVAVPGNEQNMDKLERVLAELAG